MNARRISFWAWMAQLRRPTRSRKHTVTWMHASSFAPCSNGSCAVECFLQDTQSAKIVVHGGPEDTACRTQDTQHPCECDMRDRGTEVPWRSKSIRTRPLNTLHVPVIWDRAHVVKGPCQFCRRPASTTKSAFRKSRRRRSREGLSVGPPDSFQHLVCFVCLCEAYAAVLKRSKSDIQPKGSGGAEAGSSSTPLHKFTKDAVFYAEQAKDAAEEISLLACRSFDLCALAAEARGLQKRAALRELMAITRQGALRLRDCSTNMRILRVSSCYVAECAAQALEEYGQWAASIMSGVGLQERGEVVKTTGLSCGMTADHLDDMAVNDENMVGMLENPECSIESSFSH